MVINNIMNTLYLLILLVVIAIIVLLLFKKEAFDIGIGSSSAWDWNTGPGYGDGYGTGYAMWGVWPESIPDEPWKPWMWGRRPKTFVKQFTPAPQIDYNTSNDLFATGTTNYYISTVGDKLIINGVVTPVLQLDRNRLYYFHIHTPNNRFVFSDGKFPLYQPLASDNTYPISFDFGTPKKLFYSLAEKPECMGVIYLNDVKVDRAQNLN